MVFEIVQQREGTDDSDYLLLRLDVIEVNLRLDVSFSVEWKHDVVASCKSWRRLNDRDFTLFVFLYVAEAFCNSLVKVARLRQLKALRASLLVSQNKKRDFVLLYVLREPKDLVVSASVEVDYF